MSKRAAAIADQDLFKCILIHIGLDVTYIFLLYVQLPSNLSFNWRDVQKDISHYFKKHKKQLHFALL